VKTQKIGACYAAPISFLLNIDEEKPECIADSKYTLIKEESRISFVR
jgi:hypothetical protein